MSEKAVSVISKSKDSSLTQPPSTTTTTLKVESEEVVQKEKKPERKQEYTDIVNSLIQQQHQLSTPKNQ